MRQITDHKINGLNDAIEITATDKITPERCPYTCQYSLRIIGYILGTAATPEKDPPTVIRFQNGPINETGYNGLSNEALLAVVIDRMRGFQHQRLGALAPGDKAGDFDYNSRGLFACRENAIALTHLEEALMWLQKRTLDRYRRGVEGTNIP